MEIAETQISARKTILKEKESDHYDLDETVAIIEEGLGKIDSLGFSSC